MKNLNLINGIEVFHFNEEAQSFESFSEENGFTFWWASLLMECLGYESEASFSGAINKAMVACNTLNIEILDNFVRTERTLPNGTKMKDWKLSRFACYLVAMNGDNKKEGVAKAQAYFATIAGAIQDYMIEAYNVDRLLEREEISEREKSLAGLAYQSGVKSYALFQNAGYRGMYNKNIWQLKAMRKIDAKSSLLDFMGKTELAANTFRLTQTELKIKNEGINGQADLEQTAELVGKEVRAAMIKINKIAPESLPKEKDINDVKKELKAKNKRLKKLGEVTKKKKK